MRRVARAAIASLAWSSPVHATCPDGLVVEDVLAPYAAHRAGVQPGDILCRWERAASPPASPEITWGVLTSPFDLEEVEIEQAPRGEVTLTGTRNGQPLLVRLPPAETGDWKLIARPPLEPVHLSAYERARALVGREEYDEGFSRWRDTAAAVAATGRSTQAVWLWYRLGRVASQVRRWNEADDALARARTAQEKRILALVQAGLGDSFRARSEWERAAAAYRDAVVAYRAVASSSLGEAGMLRAVGNVAYELGDLHTAEQHLRGSLAIREALAPDSLDVARSLTGLGSLAWSRGDLKAAEEHYRRGLATRERRAPDGLEVAASLTSLGALIGERGDLTAAQGHFERALAIEERLAPDSEQIAATLNNLGHVAFVRGDLVAADGYGRRALAIQEQLTSSESVEVAALLNNLGAIAITRGDLTGGEDYVARALSIREKLTPQSAPHADVLGNLGDIAVLRGDFAGGEDHYRRVLAIRERVAADSLEVAAALNDLGDLAEQRGDLAAAENHHRRALGIVEKIAPESVDAARGLHNLGAVVQRRGDLAGAGAYLQRALTIAEGRAPNGEIAGDVMYSLGEVALAAGDLSTAEAHFRRSLEIRQAVGPGSVDEASSCERLATVLRKRNQPGQALELYRRALDALDSQRRTLGGTDEIKSRFVARYASYYRDTLELLLELGHPADAFHILERYRARVLLALLAERELVFSADVSEELDRERRMVNTEYDRALAELGKANENDAPAKRAALARVGRRRAEVVDKIRAASPRLSSLQDPSPLDLTATRAALDPGTLLLSYTIGEDKSYVFAVGPAADEFGVFRLDANAHTLRTAAARFRELLEGRRSLERRQLDRHSRDLSASLLGPVAERLRRAERVVILPDGPLHLIPFASLADPRGKGRYLVEGAPLHVAASATVFAELKKTRRSGSTARLVALGDPDYSAVASPATAQTPSADLRFAQDRGLSLRPLPASRRELEELRSLYPEGSRIYLGREATEDRAKSGTREATLLHFACHGLADERSPLDSALALSMPADWKPGQPNGLLQAWEIFEQVRIDADLVTLSACGTALGKEMSGEGILGLTRAFQYAGARSVLASLWAVNDDSTADLMRRFYRHLRDGQTKDAALRAAQVEMIRRGRFSHPGRWAAFQLIGDWR